MFKNIFYNTKKNEIHLYEQIKGENFYTTIPWTPYLYVLSTERDSDVKTIYGKNAKKKTFNTFYEYSDFQKNNKDNLNIYENNVKSEIQFLAERYHGIPDEEMEVPNLLVYYIDIETLTQEGFPDWKNPQDPIVLISIRNGITKKTITFGCDPIYNRSYTGTKKDIKYIKCSTEEELLKRFFAFMYKFSPDVFSGFNVLGSGGSSGFDIPYIINRSKVLFGEDDYSYKKMSPINFVNVWKQKSSDNLNIDIAGMTILDYMDLYKTYGKNLERYSLEYICQKELGVGKLVNNYGSMREQIEKDWNEFVEYNVMDCERVNDLEDKLGYIKMIQSLSLLCKCPMKYYMVQTQLIDALMLTYFRRNKLCAPHFKGGEKENFRAAYIKEPQIGFHKWVVDLDIKSSYPSHIISLNMSSETFFGCINLSESEVIKYTKKRSFPSFSMIKEFEGQRKTINVNGNKLIKFNKALKKGLFSIAPCGSVFNTVKPGVISIVQKYVFFKRDKIKRKRDKFGLKVNKCIGDEKTKCKERERELDSFQLAIKLIGNGFYGILSVPYSRYHNIYIAKAITSCGRRTIRQGEIFSNDILNNPNENLKSILNEIEGEV